MGDWVLIEGDVDGDIAMAGEEIVVAADTPITAANDADDSDSDPDSGELPDPRDDFAGYDESYYDGTVAECTGMPSDKQILLEVLRLQVLPRLPATSLLRFREVSTSWKQWISSPFFTLAHAVQPQPLTGLFFHLHDSSPAFATISSSPAWAPDFFPGTVLASIPEPVSVKASTRGIICAKGKASGLYYVANPATRQWAPLPAPSVDHGPDAAVAVVFDEPSAYNFTTDYHVVVVYPVCDDGVYAFESFESKAGRWKVSSVICQPECVVAASGVAASGSAFWRTTMGSFLAYDTVNDSWQIIRPPREVIEALWWELGEMEGKLSITSVAPRGREVQVRVMVNGKEGMRWRRIGRFDPKICRMEVTLLRTQSAAEVLIWDNEKKESVVMDLAGNVVRQVADGPTYCADFVPYVSSLVEIRKYNS